MNLWVLLPIWLSAISVAGLAAETHVPADGSIRQGRILPNSPPALASFIRTGASHEYRQFSVAGSGAAREQRKASLEIFENVGSTLGGVGDVGDQIEKGFTREVVVKGGIGSQQVIVGSMRYPVVKTPDNWEQFHSATKAAGAIGKVLKWGTRASKSADILRSEGSLYGPYLVGKEIAVSEFSDKVGKWVTAQSFQILMAGGSPAFIPVASLASWAAGELAKQATKGLLEAVFAALENALRMLFEDLFGPDNLDAIIASGLAALDTALQERIAGMKPLNSVDLNTLRKMLDNAPDATRDVMKGIVTKAAVDVGQAALQTSLNRSRTLGGSGDSNKLYDVHTLVGPDWQLSRGVPAGYARQMIDTFDQVAADPSRSYNGIVAEYWSDSPQAKAAAANPVETGKWPTRYRLIRKYP